MNSSEYKNIILKFLEPNKQIFFNYSGSVIGEKIRSYDKEINGLGITHDDIIAFVEHVLFSSAPIFLTSEAIYYSGLINKVIISYEDIISAEAISQLWAFLGMKGESLKIEYKKGDAVDTLTIGFGQLTLAQESRDKFLKFLQALISENEQSRGKDWYKKIDSNTRIIGTISIKADRIASENIIPGETIFYEVQGISGDTLIVTSQKILNIKTGIGAFAIGTIGISVKTFALDMLTGVDQKKGIMSGHVEFTIPGISEIRRGGFLDAAGSENVFQYDLKYHAEIVHVVNKIRELSLQARQSNAIPEHNRQITDDIPTQIKKLADLKEQGILTEEEFKQKKTDLLSKM